MSTHNDNTCLSGNICSSNLTALLSRPGDLGTTHAPAPTTSPEDRKLVEDRISELATSLRLDPETAESLKASIIRAYEEGHRRYHTVQHIATMLTEIALAKTRDIPITKPDELTLAILFHDIVYNPKKSDTNEDDSIKIFNDFAKQASLDESVRRGTFELIEISKGHNPVDFNHPDGFLFSDVDLKILSHPKADYSRYAQQIRAEYRHVSDQDFTDGRARFTSKFVEERPIYHTKYYKSTFEDIAKENVEREVTGLFKKLEEMKSQTDSN